jgi:hypothetical protein
MRAIGIVATFLAVAALPAAAAFEELELGVADLAMGGTGVLGAGPSSAGANPAALARIGGMEASAASRLPFSVADLATHGIDLAVPVSGSWAAGAGLRAFGFEEYREVTASATVAGRLGRGMWLGVQPVFGSVDIADGQSSYGSASGFSMNLGLQAEVYDRWMLAASVHNLFESRIGESGETFERRLDVGASFEASAGMISRVALSRDYRGMRVHAGQSLPLGPLTLMAGVRSSPACITGGASATISGVTVEYAVETHPDLDPTHQAGVRYAF